MNEKYVQLRSDFTDVIMAFNGCTYTLCSVHESCNNLLRLMPEFGLAYDHEKYNGTDVPALAIRVDQVTAENVPIDIFDLTLSYDVLDIIRCSGSWKTSEPFAGFSEVPMTVGKFLHEGEWQSRYQQIDEHQLPQEEQAAVHRNFVLSFVEAIFTDEVLDFLQSQLNQH
jgi:hypothetical protein